MTIAQLSRGQTSITVVKIDSHKVKIFLARENSDRGKNLINQIAVTRYPWVSGYRSSPAGIQIVPAGIHFAPAGIEIIPTGIEIIPASMPRM